MRADVLGEECSELMKTFFKNRSEQAKKERERLRLRRKNIENYSSSTTGSKRKRKCRFIIYDDRHIN